MSEIQKIMIAVFGAILSGFILVGVSKQEPSAEQKEAGSKIRNFVNMQTMANHKCPLAIKEHTGEQVYVIEKTESDKETYLTMKWDGENVKTGGFKKASCTISAALGGISELVIDGKVIIKKKI
jgi:flagellar hook assembly protein FlgD